jgi:hypothetical protein
MHIHLNDEDISKMPERLRHLFLDWLPEYLKTKNFRSEQISVTQQPKPVVSPTQLLLNLDSQKSEDKADNSHVRLSELFDAGMTKRGMAIRVKLKREEAKKRGRDYINSMEISAKGTIFYDGEDFDKPSPLATKINGGATNGWEYIEVKKNGEWVCLDELRKIWRNTND